MSASLLFRRTWCETPDNDNVIPGCFRVNPAIAGAMRCAATAGDALIFIGTAGSAHNDLAWIRIRSAIRYISSAPEAIIRPCPVSVVRRGKRSVSLRPRELSRAAIRRPTVAWSTPSSLAAADREPHRARAKKKCKSCQSISHLVCIFTHVWCFYTCILPVINSFIVFSLYK